MAVQIDSRLERRLLSPSRFQGEHALFSYSHAAPENSTRERLRGVQRLFVLGMGGSVLPLQSLSDGAGLHEKLIFIETLDPEQLKVLDTISSEDRLAIVSKSGRTFEVQAVLSFLWSRVSKEQLLVVTDPQQSPLKDWAEKERIPCEWIPPDIGGRFTQFIPFHQALLEEWGVPYRQALESARMECERLKNEPEDLEKLFALSLADSRDLILWQASERLKGLARWTQQVLAESLGKMDKASQRQGVLPILLYGPQDQHSVLQYLMDGPQRYSFLFLDDEDLKARGEAVSQLSENLISFQGLKMGQLQQILFESTYQSFLERTENPTTYQSVGRLQVRTKSFPDFVKSLVLIHAFIEYAADRLQINAYDQPGVERGKQIAKELLAVYSTST